MNSRMLAFSPFLTLILAFVISMAAFAKPAFARLGEDERTVESDRAAMRGAHSVTAQGLFHVHVIQGTSQTVREYANGSGMVFAVSWRGVGAPDLSQLFGSYYQEYRDVEAATPKPPGRAPKIMQSSNLVIRRFGHMGDIRGLAYIPALMPEGVSVQDLR